MDPHPLPPKEGEEAHAVRRRLLAAGAGASGRTDLSGLNAESQLRRVTSGVADVTRPRMRYVEPEDRPEVELLRDLSASDVGLVTRALMDCANFRDGAWSVERILPLVNDARADVARTAMLALGLLAVRRSLPTDRRVWAALLEALNDPELAGTAADVLSDLEMFGTVGRSLP